MANFLCAFLAFCAAWPFCAKSLHPLCYCPDIVPDPVWRDLSGERVSMWVRGEALPVKKADSRHAPALVQNHCSKPEWL